MFQGRFIPTCVGNSTAASIRCCSLKVHPHMRGELVLRPFGWRSPSGSSPHAWGTRLRQSHHGWRQRFIPTCVGNSCSRRSRMRTFTVHPHMRGELVTYVPGVGYKGGSSPHAWGTPLARTQRLVGLRFIPTCVGNSVRRTRQSADGSVHPHMRGELRLIDGDRPLSHGSSPHAWGTLGFGGMFRRSERFIPTCVGNSWAADHPDITRKVHPHMRGELHQVSGSRLGRHGSSPHAWGTLPLPGHLPSRCRFIPTCVGNSPPKITTRSRLSVHPHMRGELRSRQLARYRQ